MNAPIRSVSSAAVAVQLTATAIGSTGVRATGIRAPETNGGTVYLGGSDVSAANGFPLYPGDTFDLADVDLSVIYAMSDTEELELRLFRVHT